MGRWEKGPPQNALILFFGILTALTLVSLKPAFDAYYDGMFDRAVEHQQTTYDDLETVTEAENRWRATLAGGRLPIDTAMDQLATRGRNAFPAISPRADAEQNLDALRGWGQLPQELPERPAPALDPLMMPGDAFSPEALRDIEGAIDRVLGDYPNGTNAPQPDTQPDPNEPQDEAP